MLRSSISVLLASTIAAAAAADLPTYRVTAIGPDLQSFGMNERGDIVGRKLLNGSLGVAFVATLGGAVEELPVPAEWLGSDAYAISDQGVIVGAVSTVGVASIGSRAAAWFPTTKGYEFVLLGALPGHQYSTALAVNNLGDIVGGSGGIGLAMYSNAVLFTAPGVTDLPGISIAADVNDSRTVVAGNNLLDLDTMAVTTIPLPPGNWQGMQAGDINNVGGICGYVAGFSGCSTFPIKWEPGPGWTFLGGCATTTSATSLNDQGDAVTFVYNGGFGVVFEGAGYTNVGSLIAPGQGNWLLTGLGSINNARMLTAAGKELPNGVSTLLRLVPIVVGDLDGDARVNAADLTILLSAWGNFGGDADLNGDGPVDAADLSVLLSSWTA
jgi:hypothetical protein